MKALRTLLTVLSLGVLFFYSGCGGGGGGSQTIQDKQLGLLKKTWKVSSVSLDNVDQTSTWTNFTITITGTNGQNSGSYSCLGRPTAGCWAASGTWAFDTTTPASLIIRDPGTGSGAENLPIGYTATSTTLQLTFTYPTNGTVFTGRMASSTSVSGNWVFNLVPSTN